MLELKSLACARGQRLLFKEVNARMEPGTVVHVAGDNGAGKTSLLRLIAGLSQPAYGEIAWKGEAIDKDRARFHQDLVYLGHLPGIKDDLTALENLSTNAALAGEPVDQGAARAVLVTLGLEGQLNLPAKGLSAGQRRRVALARLWLTKKPLWLLDEPFTALDQTAVQALIRQIESHLNAGGLCLYTTHQVMLMEAPRKSTLMLGGERA